MEIIIGFRVTAADSSLQPRSLHFRRAGLVTVAVFNESEKALTWPRDEKLTLQTSCVPWRQPSFQNSHVAHNDFGEECLLDCWQEYMHYCMQGIHTHPSPVAYDAKLWKSTEVQKP